MKVESIDLHNPSLQSIELAKEILMNDGVIVYPTDTAYGIGVNATSEEAIKKLYDIKGREGSKPTHVVVKDWEMIETISKPNKIAYTLYEKIFPGPLTLIISKDDAIIPNSLTGNLPTIGVRIPNTRFTQQLSNFFPYPYTTPSANRNAEATPYSIDEVRDVLDIEAVDLILDAGTLKRELPSTIVDCTNDYVKVLREGPITQLDIQNCIHHE